MPYSFYFFSLCANISARDSIKRLLGNFSDTASWLESILYGVKNQQPFCGQCFASSRTTKPIVSSAIPVALILDLTHGVE
jgi:hypothetical protein